MKKILFSISLLLLSVFAFSQVDTTVAVSISGRTVHRTLDQLFAAYSGGTTYTFSTGLTDAAGTVTANLSTGVSGGQSVIGGTASGNNLTLSSTSNATKGKILFGTSAYDEVNNRLGLGNSSPSGTLHLGSGTSFGDFTTPALIFGTTVNGMYLDTDKIHVKAGSNFAGGFGSGYFQGNSARINTASSANDLTTNKFIPYWLTANGLNAGMGGNSAGDVSLIANDLARLVVLKDGNIGIGISAPISWLHVYESTSSTSTTAGLTIQQNGTGDAITQYLLTGGQRWVVGLDNSDSDKFKIASTADLNTNDQLTITTTGLVGLGIASPISKTHIYENNANTDATVGLTIEQDDTGDALQHFLLTAGRRWTVGIDNSDADKYKVTTDGVDYIEIDDNAQDMTLSINGAPKVHIESEYTEFTAGIRHTGILDASVWATQIDDWAPVGGDSAYIFLIDMTGGSQIITGMSLPNFNGLNVRFVNIDNNDSIYIAHENVSSSANNRFWLEEASAVIVPPGGCADCHYLFDGTNSRWRCWKMILFMIPFRFRKRKAA